MLRRPQAPAAPAVETIDDAVAFAHHVAGIDEAVAVQVEVFLHEYLLAEAQV